MAVLGETKVCGYNRLNQNVRWGLLLTAMAGTLQAVQAKDAVPTPVPHVRSVVRTDPRTHQLVRAIEVVRPASPPASRTPDPAVKELVEQAAKSYDVNPLLVHSVIAVESNFDPYAVSPKGAQGIMQLMPDTARRFGVSNAFDVKQNIDAGVRYLQFLQNRFGDDLLAVAAYNAGEGAVQKYNGIPPYRETVDYVKRVGAHYGKAQKEAASKAPPSVDISASGEKHAVLEMFYDEQGRVHLVTR